MSTPPTTRVIYQQQHFRSELHARWAVFFDALAVSWEYEKQTFDLPYGGPFMPDFWMPLQPCWFLIHPNLPSEQELVQAADLSFATRCWVYLMWGNIGEHSIYAFNLPFCEQGYDKRFVLTLVEPTGELIVASPLRGDDEYQLIGYSYSTQQAVLQKANAVTSNERLNSAYQAARTARFEQETTC